ncbi:histidine phosphatase family protein [Cytobacillus sp. IB215316]|uniref:histidine phosphatase family protein n=1 Tax=Cytobacillus sp. IB215316 TaxID=3097354 RepID=UPI002A180D03|nr:histidine phosphatase family protein [Cytobacillus sp. IB215316]MDX8363204.1 histidine phosphatase family protein [Cytobacillus sp. IB215316]
MNQTIYLIRHGETVFNTEGRYQGELDSPLTIAGIDQVKNISRLLKLLIDDPNEWTIYSSPLGRTIQSTKIICETLGYDFNKVIIDNTIKEVSVGSWAGLTTKEIEATWSKLIKNTDSYNWYFKSPDGESYETVVERASKWLDSIKGREKVIVISHGLMGRVLRGVYKQMDKEEALRLEVSQNTLFKLNNQDIERISYEYEEF